MAALAHLTAMDGRSRTSMCFAAPAHPGAMDSDEPMDTDEPWADKSSQADEPTGSGLTPPATKFVPILCVRERNSANKS